MSVVIPVRDDARLLEACLAALGRQTRLPDEVVVVDNGSRDDSAAVARAAGARVITEPVQGIPRAASAGYDAATGDVIARIDADTRCPPGWLARVEARFTADPRLDFLTGDATFYGSRPWVHRLARYGFIGLMYATLTPLLGHSSLFGSNMAMRSAAWRALSSEVHREPREIHDDLDLSLHVHPGMTVARDRGLVVSISARPLPPRQFARRVRWAAATLRLHGMRDAPWRRWARRARARAARSQQPAG